VSQGETAQNIAEKAEGAWIRTFSGGRTYFLSPQKNEFRIEDIAHGLSNVCRFSGQVKEFYSVAQHSVHVSQLVPAQHALKGLLHDAAEAYMADTPGALKALIPGFKEIENGILDEIFHTFGLSPGIPPVIKTADNVLLATEARDLMAHDGEDWREVLRDWNLHGAEPHSSKIIPWSAFRAEHQFLYWFKRYTE
jgi:hypothetical protein